jgi:glycosyltransferase involved in cell wall biosynthesis
MRIRSGRPHVVILDENLPVPLDRRVWEEARALTAAGYRVTIISPRGGGEMHSARETRDGVAILRYPQRAASGLAGYFVEYLPSMVMTGLWLVAVRLRGRIDVVHGCNPPDLFFVFGRLAHLWGGRYVFDQHDANPELAATKWGDRRLGRVLVRLTTALEGASYRTADVVLVPNDSYGALAASRGGVPADSIVVVRNAPPGDRFRTLAAGIAPPADGSFRLGYLGVMGSQDGVELLIAAMARLVELLPDRAVSLDLVGDGEARPALERQAAELGLTDRVRFHGYQGPEVFVPILAATHVCVSPDPPTPFNDVSTMTKVVEYLAIGRPVVAFGLTETLSILGEAGVIAPDGTADGLAKALASLAGDPARIDRLTAAAATRIDELDLRWERSATRLVDAYRSLLAETGAGTAGGTGAAPDAPGTTDGG